MPERRGVLLTGATGFLGQYLLRDLLRQAYPVAVLVRDAPPQTASERIDCLVQFWSDRLGQELPTPTVVTGDLGQEDLGLDGADRRWLGVNCQRLIHAAASLSFRPTPDGEPWRTNLRGTQALLALSREIGLTEWHHVSSAFVCGRQTGIIAEELAPRPSFHNAYEESKWQAERAVRGELGVRATVYRPSVIVGDSRQGHATHFHGLYRFLELATRLAAPDGAHTPLRLPLTGDETWNLVPVDWVSRAVIELAARPLCHGRTFHLVSATPVSTRWIRDVASDLLSLPEVEFAWPGGVGDPSRLEQWFLDGIREYWPYLGGNPTFACTNTRAALPDLPPPAIDRPVLERLIRFAVAVRWGRAPQEIHRHRSRAASEGCADYIERVFPQQARRSELARAAGLDLTVGIDVHGAGGGQWSCTWRQGEFAHTRRGLEPGATVTYHTDTATFQAIVSRKQTPQQAFFEQRLDITGDVETALKLAVLFGQLLEETSVSQSHRTEVTHSASLHC